jgi:hypothetical protein
MAGNPVSEYLVCAKKRVPDGLLAAVRDRGLHSAACRSPHEYTAAVQSKPARVILVPWQPERLSAIRHMTAGRVILTHKTKYHDPLQCMLWRTLRVAQRL